MDRDERRAWFAAAGDVTRMVSVETKVGTFLVRTADDNVGASLFKACDRREFHVVADAVTTITDLYGHIDDRTFLDVGANIGTSTIPALRAGFARAVAIEPEPVNFETLRLNLLLNGVEDRVATVQSAVSDYVGTAVLDVDLTKSGKHRLTTNAKHHKVRVDVTTLDALAEAGVYDPAAVGLLWVDTQGQEGNVLRAATQLMAARCPIVFEMHRSLVDSGGMDVIEDAVAGYKEFVDMRSDGLGRHPMSDFHAFTQQFHGERRMTDLLVLG